MWEIIGFVCDALDCVTSMRTAKLQPEAERIGGAALAACAIGAGAIFCGAMGFGTENKKLASFQLAVGLALLILGLILFIRWRHIRVSK